MRVIIVGLMLLTLVFCFGAVAGMCLERHFHGACEAYSQE